MKFIILFLIIISASVSLSARSCSFTVVDMEKQVFKEGCSKNSKYHYSDRTCKKATEYINRCSTLTVTYGVKVKKDGSVNILDGKVTK